MDSYRWGELPDVAISVLQAKAQEVVAAQQAAELARQEEARRQQEAAQAQAQSVFAGPVAASYSGGGGSCGEGLLGEIAYMESTCNNYAQNPSGATGLLQFMPGTFAGVCGTCCDIYSTECQLRAGQVMLDQGRQCEWEVLHC